MTATHFETTEKKQQLGNTSSHIKKMLPAMFMNIIAHPCHLTERQLKLNLSRSRSVEIHPRQIQY